MRLRLLVIVVCAALAGASGAGGQGVDPATVTATVPVGGSISVAKVVHTPAIPPVPDVYFLADTTASMQDAIDNVQDNAGSILSTVSSAQPSARFGAGDYKDFQSSPPHDPYVFLNDAPIGPSATAILGIDTWSASGGGDGPEGSLYALHRIATDPTILFRAGSTRILVWFGDAPAHDPVCTAFTGLGSDLTTASVAAELAAAHIQVIAVSLNTGGFPAGLDDDSARLEFDYDSVCGRPVTVTGQAATIAAATGGLDLFAASPEDVSDAILTGLSNLPVTVTPTPSCEPGLTATFDAPTRTVTSGTDALFSETLRVAGSVPGVRTVHCTVDFLLNGLHQDGFQQSAALTVQSRPGTIIVQSRTIPAGATATFSFAGDVAGSISTDGGRLEVDGLAAGTYTSTETLPAGWALAGLTCDDADSSGDVAARRATFRVAPGETVTCTFTSKLLAGSFCPTKINTRWHYRARNTSGSWSGTGTVDCLSGSIALGPQAMEGDLKVLPGTTIQTGYSFTLPGNKAAHTVSFRGASTVFTLRCVSGAAASPATLTVPIADQTYVVNNDKWYPTNQQSSPLVYQGSAVVPNACGGASQQVRLDRGGSFSSFVAAG